MFMFKPIFTMNIVRNIQSGHTNAYDQVHTYPK